MLVYRFVGISICGQGVPTKARNISPTNNADLFDTTHTCTLLFYGILNIAVVLVSHIKNSFQTHLYKNLTPPLKLKR